MVHISDIKLIRTDTTLDLSQMAEKASYLDEPSPQKIELISRGPMAHISDIKLIRTDTTLDLSQKAEKGMLMLGNGPSFYINSLLSTSNFPLMWDS
ncbi:hypothetical protein CQW23_24648 [Capsicum baccatum]|uniref:Uncharacterized protein n=1 Tax=Capsicum baccatum TaxID=33114 RepID=A0A2G2VVD6_CAPBA|nr:hypothetical protein CQW23_24648 [Capsicum baccatum]